MPRLSLPTALIPVLIAPDASYALRRYFAEVGQIAVI
jgi:hypothetical protein